MEEKLVIDHLLSIECITKHHHHSECCTRLFIINNDYFFVPPSLYLLLHTFKCRISIYKSYSYCKSHLCEKVKSVEIALKEAFKKYSFGCIFSAFFHLAQWDASFFTQIYNIIFVHLLIWVYMNFMLASF